jgi:hypothetical protein
MPADLILEWSIYFKTGIFMKKLFWILAPLILIIGVILLVIALTNNSFENPLREYRLVIGIGLICVSGFVRIAYKKLYKHN